MPLSLHVLKIQNPHWKITTAWRSIGAPLLILANKQIGGTPAVIRYLLEQGFLDGDCMTGTSIIIVLLLFSKGEEPVVATISDNPMSFKYCWL
ncbi:PREDICTED: uncharacterized protein LOC104599538 isoform X2 [Nelumbo nucifera]|uniref:Uncharacterized protein LOC104599538 isoform X2 n=1 Tax=Nelumbo nucifera TaxID=4432 RepID=A0A1U8Q4B5_NELNU|nr:PREDICTED: uncharacterized protein LOC104599538 isoform X2 [Nelumbo nucifera]